MKLSPRDKILNYNTFNEKDAIALGHESIPLVRGYISPLESDPSFFRFNQNTTGETRREKLPVTLTDSDMLKALGFETPYYPSKGHETYHKYGNDPSILTSRVDIPHNNGIPQDRALVPINLRRRPSTPSDSYGLSEFRLQPVVIDQKGNDIDFFNDVNAGSNTRNILGDMTSRGTLNQLREADLRAMRENKSRNIYGELTPQGTLVQSKREADIRAMREKAAQEMTPDTERNAEDALRLITGLEEGRQISPQNKMFREEIIDIATNPEIAVQIKNERDLARMVGDTTLPIEIREQAQNQLDNLLNPNYDNDVSDLEKSAVIQSLLNGRSNPNQKVSNNNTQWIKGVPNAVTGGVGVAGLGGLGYMLMSNDNSEPDQTQYYGDYLV